jgi:hypothetical protein
MPFDKIHPFTERAVVFLDVLGFSRLIEDAEHRPDKRDELFGIFSVLDSHVKFDNQMLSAEVPDDVKPKYIFISDSIIFSVPLLHGKYDGLAIVVAKTIQIAHKMLQIGYLLQGGINIGSVWHTASNVFGTGYIEAWRTQESANHPRVVLTKQARAHWEEKLEPIIGELCLRDTDDELIADTLNPYYLGAVTQIHHGIEQQFDAYRVRIRQQQEAFAPGSSPRQKWDWAASFFNAAITRHGVNVAPI